MIFRIEVEQEGGGRWIAEVLELAGAMTYGPTRDEAIARAKTLALRAMAYIPHISQAISTEFIS